MKEPEIASPVLIQHVKLENPDYLDPLQLEDTDVILRQIGDYFANTTVESSGTVVKIRQEGALQPMIMTSLKLRFDIRRHDLRPRQGIEGGDIILKSSTCCSL